jgi:hypothetical protein
MRRCLEVLLLLIIIRSADAITGGHSLNRFGLVHFGALTAFAAGVRSLLLKGPFGKWNDISDRQSFSEAAGFALGILLGLVCSVSAYLTHWPLDLATAVQAPQEGHWLAIAAGFGLVVFAGGFAGWWPRALGSIALQLVGRFPSWFLEIPWASRRASRPAPPV